MPPTAPLAAAACRGRPAQERCWEEAGELERLHPEEDTAVYEEEEGEVGLLSAAFERSAEELRRRELQGPLGGGRCAARRPLCAELDAAAAHRGPSGAAAGMSPVWWPAESPGAMHHNRDEALFEESHAGPLGGPAAEPLAVPAGYRALPEAERASTADQLQHKLEELEAKYARLPLRIETEGQRRQQRVLRQKIQETEDAIKRLSRPGGVLVEI